MNEISGLPVVRSLPAGSSHKETCVVESVSQPYNVDSVNFIE